MAGFTLFGPTQALLTTSMRLRAARHELLAANIANVDTPGYRPRDLDFAGVLQAVARSSGHPASMPGGKLTLVSTHAQHLPAGPRSASVFEKEPGEGKLDRNRVDLDAQVAELSENALLHEASITLFSRTMGGLRYAISEGRG